jgi:hypothetical protein
MHKQGPAVAEHQDNKLRDMQQLIAANVGQIDNRSTPASSMPEALQLLTMHLTSQLIVCNAVTTIPPVQHQLGQCMYY